MSDGKKWEEPIHWMDPVLWGENPPVRMTDEQHQEMLRILYENRKKGDKGDES